MGGGSSKKQKTVDSRVTEQDRAILVRFLHLIRKKLS